MAGLAWLLAAGAAVLVYWILVRDDRATADSFTLLDPVQIARGQTVYASTCASCHGARGEGNSNWQTRNPDDTLNPPPHDETGHTWHHADGQLFLIVRDGGQAYASAGFKSQMPAFAAQLSDEEIRDVITYLKSLWPPDERKFQAEVSQRDPFPR